MPTNRINPIEATRLERLLPAESLLRGRFTISGSLPAVRLGISSLSQCALTRRCHAPENAGEFARVVSRPDLLFRQIISMIVTIDGPAGTGKSTVARILAERLGFEFLNTGAMYRAVAYVCLQRGVDLNDSVSVGQIPVTLDIVFSNNRLLLDGHDVTEAIRGQDVTQAASLVAANPRVRERLVDLQRAAARSGNLVTEGRDQGTVVFPDAECKFFLTASPEERARRRQRELQSKGEDIPFDELLAQQELRDLRDETRVCSPLVPAPDAVNVDTTPMTLDEVAQHLEKLVRKRTACRTTNDV